MAAPAIARASRFLASTSLVLRPLVVLEGQGRSVRCHARSIPLAVGSAGETCSVVVSVGAYVIGQVGLGVVVSPVLGWVEILVKRP
jgi:hypothetical protein